MLSALVLALLVGTPVCSDQFHFSWPGSSFTHVREGAVSMRTFVWLRAGGDAFVLELAGRDRVLVGRRTKAPEVTNVEGWKKEQSEVRLPLSQGGVMFSDAGGGLGCLVTVKPVDLGGPIAADVHIDARTKWQFELRDRSMKQVLLSF